MEHWPLIQRQKQKLPEEDFTYWIIQAGRGFGKTRCAAENIVDLILSEKIQYIGIIGKTLIQVKDIMIHGPGGISQALAYRLYLYNMFHNQN